MLPITGDVKAWTVRFSLGEAGRRLGYPGTVQAIRVTRVGPSGRAVEVTVDGDRGPRTVAGPKVDAAWGLRSTFFTITTTTGTADSSLDTPTVDPVDLRAQSGVLAWADPPFTTDATADDSQTSDAAPDTTGARAAASTPTGDPNERVGRRADAAAPSARSARSAPGRNGGRIAASGATTPADSKADLFIGAAVVAGVVASIAAVRRRRRR